MKDDDTIQKQFNLNLKPNMQIFSKKIFLNIFDKIFLL